MKECSFCGRKFNTGGEFCSKSCKQDKMREHWEKFWELRNEED
uniref:Uncharacterized protein n=1 Tax=viral metagenome TaxID=1070528 RepID=A0A6M3JJ78_9ZZZZ